MALATAAGGEDDYAHDRLSYLRTVGSGFGSLIYNLKEDTGFRELSKRCEFLWKALEDNPQLPKMLVSSRYWINNYIYIVQFPVQLISVFFDISM